MCEIFTSNTFLKIGLERFIEKLELVRKNLTIIDMTTNCHMVANHDGKFVVYICDSKKRKAIELIMYNVECIVVSSKCTLKELKRAIRSVLIQSRRPKKILTFSKYEQFLLPYFLSVSDIKSLSTLTGVSCKNLYCTRSRICRKLGFTKTREFLAISGHLKNLLCGY